jgi:hypothetical protein
MIMDFTANLREIGNTIHDVFVLPGEFLLSQFAVQAPVVAVKLGFVGDNQSGILTVILSVLIWLLLAVVLTKLVTLWLNILRVVSAMMRTVSFRISLATRNFKTGLMCRLRRLIPRRSRSADAAAEVEFDNLDLAVLRSAATCGPGFATSAPELADQFKLRPSRIQRSLDKLSSNKMIDHVAGATDGFKTYRLSQSGAYFVAMWQRKGRG